MIFDAIAARVRAPFVIVAQTVRALLESDWHDRLLFIVKRPLGASPCGLLVRRGRAGEGTAESLPWRGPAGEARHTGGTISALGNEKGSALGVPRNTQTALVRRPWTHSGHQERHPCTARRRRAVWRQAESADKLLHQRCSNDSRSEGASVACTPRRDASVPAGQPKDAAPSATISRVYFLRSMADLV